MKAASAKSSQLLATKRKLNISSSTSSFKDRVSSARSSPKACDRLVPTLQLSTTELPASSTSTVASHRHSQRSLPQSPRYLPCLQTLYSSIRNYLSTTAPLLSSVSDQSVLEANYQLEQGLRLAETLLPVSSPFAVSKEQASEFPASEHEEDISKLEQRMSGLIGDIEKGVERTREKVEGQMGRRDKGDYKELCVRLEAALRKHQDEADTIQRLHYQEMEELKAQHSLQLQSLQSSLQKTQKDQEILSNSQENVRNLMRELKKANEVIANLEKWKDEKKEMEAELREMGSENRSLRARLASLQATNHAFNQQLAAYKSSMSGSMSELSTEVQRISKLQERLEIREERMKMTIADLEGVIGTRLRTEQQETMPLPTQISAVQSFSKLNTSQEAAKADVSLETEYDLSGLGRMIAEECDVSAERDSHKALIFECIRTLVLSTGSKELLTAVEILQTQLKREIGEKEGT